MNFIKLHWKILAAGAAVLVLALFAFSFLRSKPKTVSFERIPVQRGDLTITIQATATVEPENRLEIKPPLGGRAESVQVDIGDEVKQGQVLAWMSSSERATLLDAARAKGEKELAYWQDIYKPAPLVAPLDGVIIAKNLIPGQVVQATESVFVMSDRLVAQADVDETDLARVRLGQEVEVTLDAFPGENLKGKVYKIAYDAVTVNNVTTYRIDIAFDKIPDFLRSGMTANVQFIIVQKKGVLLIPADVVQSGEMVLAASDEKRQPLLKKITLGESDGKLVEVASGLQEGEFVARSAYTGPQTKKEGMSILPKVRMKGGRSGGGGPPP
ncbi:MAG: efflux RND transporter periplasmic adaptor subunit [bacterium]